MLPRRNLPHNLKTARSLRTPQEGYARPRRMTIKNHARPRQRLLQTCGRLRIRTPDNEDNSGLGDRRLT